MTVQKCKKILSFIAVLLLAVTVIVPYSLKAENISDLKENRQTGYAACVLDYAELFKDSEVKALLNKAYDLTDYSDVFVVTVQKGQNSHGTTERATKDFGDEMYLKYSNQDNCIMFIIDMHTRYLYVYRYGDEVESTLTSGKCDSITDNVYEYASDKDYYTCASIALDQMGKVLAGQHIAQPMKVASNLFIAFVIGFVVMYLVALSKSKVGKPSDEEMLKYAAISFAANNPSDVVTGTTKTYCPRSSGSGRGGRSGGGGGFRGGGGGGHRF